MVEAFKDALLIGDGDAGALVDDFDGNAGIVGKSLWGLGFGVFGGFGSMDADFNGRALVGKLGCVFDQVPQDQAEQ